MSLGSREQAWGAGLHRQTSSLTQQHHGNQAPPIYLWMFKEPNNIFKLNSERIDQYNLRDYLEKMFHLDGNSYTLASLIPGVAYPMPLLKGNADIYKGMLICLPTEDVNLNFVTKHQDVITIVVNPIQTVKDLKYIISEQKGYPVQIQEFLYNNQILENKKLIIDYRITDGSRINLDVQPEPPFVVYVETFWGKRYMVEVNSYSNSEDVLNKVFRKTLAKPAYREQILKFKSMYKGLIVLHLEDQSLEKDKCLNYYGVSECKTISISLISERRGDQSKTVRVEEDTNECIMLNSASYDTWFIIALKIHGITSIPIDTMKLLLNDRPVDLQCNISVRKVPDEVINVSLFQLPPPSSLMGKLTIKVTTPTGLVESVQCGPRETIKDVKKRLESVGIENAQLYDMYYKNVRLPGHTKLLEYKLSASEQCQMELKLNEYPIKIRYDDAEIRLAVNNAMTVSQLLGKVEERTGCSALVSKVIHTGEDIYTYESLRVHDTVLYLGSSIYVEKVTSTCAMQLNTDHGTILLPNKATFDAALVEKLEECDITVSAFSNSYKWFLKWRFPQRVKLMRDFRKEVMVNTPQLVSKSPFRMNSRMSRKDSPIKYTTGHNNSLRRNTCKSSSSRQSYHHDYQQTSKSEQQPTLPDITRANNRLPSYHSKPHHSSQELLPKPRPALKSHSKSQEILSPDLFSNLTGKKKGSVRFEVEEPRNLTKQRLPVFPWHSAKRTSQHSQEVIVARKQIHPSKAHPRSHHHSLSPRRSADRGEVANVAVRFQMDV